MKSLIVYYSHSGTTRRLAELITRETGGDLLELVPETAYPQDYNAVVAQAKRELQSGHRPALKTALPDLSAYDMVFVGTPNWWSSPAPPVLTFLEQADAKGATVAPFCTHGGRRFRSHSPGYGKSQPWRGVFARTVHLWRLR